MPDLRTVIARAIRAERTYAGLHQQDVADALGLSRSAITRIENGTRPLGVEELYAICRLLGVGLPQLLARADPRDRRVLLGRHDTGHAAQSGSDG